MAATRSLTRFELFSRVPTHYAAERPKARGAEATIRATCQSKFQTRVCLKIRYIKLQIQLPQNKMSDLKPTLLGKPNP